ncbi:hypothetical protein ABKV19_001070 [Rosa sericea]
MADSGADNPKQRQPKKSKKKRKQSGPEESERPPKTNRTNSPENENEPQDQNFEVGKAEKPNQGGPWRNLELILSIQNRELDLHKKVELAHGFVMSRVKEEGGSSDEDNQAVNMSLLISEGKKVESGGEKHQAEVVYTYLDLRCWEIFKFCLEESLKLNVFLTFSRNLLRSICWISRSALSLLNKTSIADRLKNVALHQISSQWFIDSSLYEQRFVRRYFAKRFCLALEKSTLPFISDFPSGNVKFKSSPNWPNVLSDLENSSLAISCNKLNVFDCSSASSCKGQNSQPSTIMKFTACQSLLNLLSCMPKGHLDTRSFSRYVTSILNLERIVVGGLLDYQNASYSTYYYELFRLFVSCRKALRCIITACEETVASRTSDTVLFEDLFPVSWLYKSVHMVAGLQESFSKDIYHQVHDMILALMDHTFYVFLTNPTLSRDLFDKMVQLQLRALGKCITLQGKRATLASHETSTNTPIGERRFSEASSFSGWEYLLDEFKARLRSLFGIRSVHKEINGVASPICSSSYQKSPNWCAGRVHSEV